MPQLNAQTTVSGYSPMQWVLGFQPQVPGLMLSEEITPQRLAGGASFVEADTDRKMSTPFDAMLDRTARWQCVTNYWRA